MNVRTTLPDPAHFGARRWRALLHVAEHECPAKPALTVAERYRRFAVLWRLAAHDDTGVSMSERPMSDRWHDSSTDRVERYEMTLRGARGVVVRAHDDGGGYSAYVGDAGRQQWAGHRFGAVQDAQAWCERALVARTSYA
jgi:hypothetical protein